MREPNRLRYVECELPDELEKAILAFEDDFDENMKPFYDRLADFTLNDAPIIAAELDAQIALREELLKGSPVQSLGSLAAIDESLKLTSPARNDNDPETVRLDERKLGAAGIALVNGSILKMITGTRLTAMRHLWQLAGGDYNYFILLGSDVAMLPENAFVLYESHSTSGVLPFVNVGFEKLKSMGYKNSEFRHRLIWKSSVSATFSFRNKLSNFGFDSEQINNIFAGNDPNEGFDYAGTLDTVTMMIQAVSRLLFLSPSDFLRNPPWKNESNYIELAITNFLDYRLRKYTTSAVFDLDFFRLLISGLKPEDIKELLEQRPEIANIELPQVMSSVTTAVERALAIPASGSSSINTYMLGLPSTQRETQLTHTLYNLGYQIYQRLLPVDPTHAQRLKDLLLELIASSAFVPLFTDVTLVDFSELSALFPNVNLPPAGVLVASVAAATSEDPALLQSAVAANSEATKIQVENAPTSGIEQGLPTEDTFGMLLSRRVQWDKNFVDCRGNATTEANAVGAVQASAVSTATSTVVNKGSFSSDAGATFEENYAFLKEKLDLKTKSVEEIRTQLNIKIKYMISQKLLSKEDQSYTDSLSVVNSSSDLNTVVTKATDVLVTVLSKVEASTSSDPSLLASEGLTSHKTTFTGEQASAKNRRYVEQQGGKKSSAGLTAGETQKLKKTIEDGIGQKVPWLGTNSTSFNQSIKFDLSECKPAWRKDWEDAIAMFTALGDQATKYGKKASKWLIEQLNIIKQILVGIQDKIDSFILAIQIALDNLLAKMERLMSIDLNLSGKLGFDNSLLKCSWGIDLGIKINLLDLLLFYINRLLGTIMGPFLKGLDLVKDFLEKIFCIPIKYLEGLLGAASSLLGMIGCSLKDVKLPVEILEILSLIMGFFQLRMLVLRQGSNDWYNMMGKVSLLRDDFAGLSQFAAFCQNPNLAKVLNETAAKAALMVSSIPISKPASSYSVGLP